MCNNEKRYPAYPLITCDPYFNVWSMSDTLNGDFTRHWTGKQHSMTGIITVDGVPEVFMGRMYHNPRINHCGAKNIEQKSVKVTPLKTEYVFGNDKISLTVSFVTPLVMTDPMLMSTPVSYISYAVKSIDGNEHNCSVYFDVSALLAVDNEEEYVNFGRTDISVWAGKSSEGVLAKKGDDVRINWGYVHLAASDGKLGFADDLIKSAAYIENRTQSFSKYHTKAGDGGAVRYPVLYYTNDYTVDENGKNSFLCIAYDDIHSLEYFGKAIDAYYKKDGKRFYAALADALENYDIVMKKVEDFDEQLLADAGEISDEYVEIISIAYRQAVAAHKLAYDGKQGLFISKECLSGGFAATVDVTYPSIPLFLKYNPNLVEYMLNSIFDFEASNDWIYDFAPHDAGIYPSVNGQMYGFSAGELMLSLQMPVEECGNMLLCVAALCKAKNNTDYAKKHFDVLQKWASYLEKNGYDPESQLCTDDFAGHLAHNCNLSIKAIMGIAAWGMILTMMGESENGNKYITKARELARLWKRDAFDKDHYRLAFDKEGTWSIKYNLAWDKLFKLNIFDEDIFQTEISYYKTKINKYGLPLDCRSDYTKSDWQMWSTVLSDDTQYRDSIISAMRKMLSDTEDRVPFTDWYYSSTAIQRGFQNRTVQGGLFIPLIQISSEFNTPLLEAGDICGKRY